MTRDQLERRIETARNELRRATEFKYRIINRECALDETVDRVIAIVQAEKSRIDWDDVPAGQSTTVTLAFPHAREEHAH